MPKGMGMNSTIAPSNVDSSATLAERLELLERLVSRQQEQIGAQQQQITTQREEIARLRAAAPVPAAAPSPSPAAAGEVSHAPSAEHDARPTGRRQSSRRALLKLGGAAAAAGVAAVAAGATELAHPGTAHANGVVWQTRPPSRPPAPASRTRHC
jgi:HPt (histidine-containing phosphotransfer) domain-containing protein